jgi:hypothetical protein
MDNTSDIPIKSPSGGRGASYVKFSKPFHCITAPVMLGTYSGVAAILKKNSRHG